MANGRINQARSPLMLVLTQRRSVGGLSHRSFDGYDGSKITHVQPGSVWLITRRGRVTMFSPMGTPPIPYRSPVRAGSFPPREARSSRMLKKATEIEECVKKALRCQPDYSIAFTHQVGALAKRIQDALSASVEHDSDMNYGSGQKIVVWLNKTCRLVAPRSSEAVYRLEDHVSSRGRLFTFVTLRLAPSDRHWK